ncbi:PqqD family protein [Myxococcus sp. K15C18031901]|uniref:PqqD family protein n=1 Tax=Myxococcus dinghuensis TaxID=2906761 RepID=UPI0020A81BB9|nr:PqqD family peptide modification chaperone [Myxococcus dinghuensis]MCP3099374.1 PqqD family protein [Myxococcus dinghuensis]
MSGVFEPESHPRRRAGADGQRFGADYLLLDAEGRTLRGLNATAVRIWELSDGTRTARAVAEVVAREFSMDVKQVLSDTLRFLSDLARLGLIDELQEVR